MLSGHLDVSAVGTVDLQMTRNKIQLSTSSQKCLTLQPIDEAEFCDWLYAVSPLLVGQLRSDPHPSLKFTYLQNELCVPVFVGVDGVVHIDIVALYRVGLVLGWVTAASLY